jgi:phthalate 4,5-dioxygenase
MLSREDNLRVTQTGSSTPAGEMLRSFWQPAALVEELDERRPSKPVRLLGEDLVLFRDDEGEYGLIGRMCAHRGSDLAYGRVEHGGLRCLYHGWLYDRQGSCLEQPAEPEASRFHTKIRQPAYPCREQGGIVFAYLGGGDPPPLPDYDCFLAPDEHTFAYKGWWECNWLQGLEGGIDPSHVSFLHRFLVDEDPRDAYGQQFRDTVEGTDRTLSSLVGEKFRPDIEVERTDYGMRLLATRELDADSIHVRITNLVAPNAFVIPFSNTTNIIQWHVPIDDHNHYWYMLMYDFVDPTDKETLRRQRQDSSEGPEYRPVRNARNQWGFDIDEQLSLTYTGMGLDINVHDQWAVESMGPVQDRTQEHLGVSDKAVSAYRRMLLQAIDDHAAGKRTTGQVLDADDAAALRGPIAVDTVQPIANWRTSWSEKDAERRGRSPWAVPVAPAPTTTSSATEDGATAAGTSAQPGAHAGDA